MYLSNPGKNAQLLQYQLLLVDSFCSFRSEITFQQRELGLHLKRFSVGTIYCCSTFTAK